MFFNGTDYYFFSGVKSVFRNMLHDDDIDNKDIIFVLKTKNFPFRSISRSINGKEKVIGIYNKAVINSYFNTKEKCEEIKRIIDYSSEDEIQKIIALLLFLTLLLSFLFLCTIYCVFIFISTLYIVYIFQ